MFHRSYTVCLRCMNLLFSSYKLKFYRNLIFVTSYYYPFHFEHLLFRISLSTLLTSKSWTKKIKSLPNNYLPFIPTPCVNPPSQKQITPPFKSTNDHFKRNKTLMSSPNPSASPNPSHHLHQPSSPVESAWSNTLPYTPTTSNNSKACSPFYNNNRNSKNPNTSSHPVDVRALQDTSIKNVWFSGLMPSTKGRKRDRWSVRFVFRKYCMIARLSPTLRFNGKT